MVHVLRTDDCGVCGGDNSSCGGCTDASACNYDADAEIDDGSCILGGELVVNGDFATNSDWALGNGWSIVDSKAEYDGTAASYTTLNQMLAQY